MAAELYLEIERRAKALGKSVKAVSAAAGDPSYLSKLGKGAIQSPGIKMLEAFARELNCSVADLTGPVSPDDNSPKDGAPPAQQARTVPEGGRPRDLPVLGRAVGGDKAWFEFNGERIDTIFRPPSLDGVKGAYALFMDGDSMLPKYEVGDTLYVNPARPVRAADYVVVQLRPEESGDPIRAFVKRLVSINSSHATLVSLNPPTAKPFKIARDQILHIHKITLSGEG